MSAESKISIRDWIFAQHMPPEVQAAFEKLFELPEKWRKPGIQEYSSFRDARFLCADELSELLGK